MIKENMTVKEVISKNIKLASVFKKYNLDCIGCKGSEQDTIKMVAINYGLDLKQFLKDLNNELKKAKDNE